MFEHTVAAMSHKLSESGFDSSSIDGLKSVLKTPFAGVESQYLQEKFIVKELGCIVSLSKVLYMSTAYCLCGTYTKNLLYNFILQEPVEVQVGSSHYITRQTGSQRRKVLERDNFYYIPILSTLKQILQMSFLWQWMEACTYMIFVMEKHSGTTVF